jgi:hypothetical protein
MACHRQGVCIAGALIFLASGTLLADGHGDALPGKETAATLFYSYPEVVVLTQKTRKHQRTYVLRYLSEAGTSLYGPLDDFYVPPVGRGYRYGNPTNGAYSFKPPQASEMLSTESVRPGDPLVASTSLYGFGLQADAQGGASNAGSNWRFMANPIFNMNHAHERGAAFSLRHDF